MLKLIALAALISVTFGRIPVPDGALLGIRNAGLQTLSSEIQSTNKLLEDALDAFKPINASCMAKLDKAVGSCRTCVEQKCKARAESVCKPEEWQIVLGKTIGFFKDGIPNFFTNTIPDVFVDKIGGGVIDVTKDVGNFFKDKIGGGIVDIGKHIGKGVVDAGRGVVDFGKGIGDGVVDIAKKVGDAVKDVGNAVKDGVSGAINRIKDFGSGIGKAFDDLFGKRELLLERLRRAGEPNCDQFQNDAASACQFYLKPAYCQPCSFNPDKDCAGYKAATDKIAAANAARSWMTKVTNQNYNIVQMTFNPTAVDPATGGFQEVNVKVQIFGKEFSFYLSQPINPYIPNIAGPAVAKQALKMFKSS